MNKCNIFSLYKGKGDKASLENDRGIFIMSIIRMIRDKLNYNDMTETIEDNMSDSQIGSRPGKNLRNHLFVLNSIIHEAIKKKMSIDIEVLDVKKCFDSLDLVECCNNLYEYGVRDDRLALHYEGMRENDVAVNSPVGQTDRMMVPDIVG